MPTLSQNFAQMDANSDGQLTYDEMQAYKMQHGQRELRQQFSAADRDGNNMIDRTEAASLPMLADQFAKVDANSDGKVSLDEMKAYHSASGQDWHDASKTTHQSSLPSSQEADQSRSTTSTTTTTHSTTSGNAGDSTSSSSPPSSSSSSSSTMSTDPSGTGSSSSTGGTDSSTSSGDTGSSSSDTGSSTSTGTTDTSTSTSGGSSTSGG